MLAESLTSDVLTEDS